MTEFGADEQREFGPRRPLSTSTARRFRRNLPKAREDSFLN